MYVINLLLCLGTYISFAYDLSCPDPSQAHLRRKVCNDDTDEDSKYACLADVLKNNTFQESCEEEPSFVRPGRKYVFSGSSTDGSCNPNRYQPIPFAKAMFSMCILLKSTCNELGQFLSSNTSGLEDSTCRCDFSKGYTYVNKPEDINRCIPSEEDCTCYRKQCPSNSCLSPDYKCIEANITHCSSIVDSRSERVPTTTLEIPTQVKDQIEQFYSKYVPIPTGLFLALTIMTITVIFFTKKLWYRHDPFAKWDGDHLYMKISGNWKLLKEKMCLKDFTTLLTKEGLSSQLEIDQQEQKSLNWKKDFYLIKVLKATKQGIYVNKCRRSITSQRKLRKILERSWKVPKWHKRGVEIYRKLIQDNKLVLKEMLNPVLVMDDFMQSFIFDVDQYEAITSSGVVENILEAFLKELDKTLNRGSFECLLTSLEKSKEPILVCVLEVLKTGLVQASLKSGSFFIGVENQGLKYNQKVLLSVKPVVDKQIPESEFRVQVMKYFTYFIEEFGLHLDYVSSFSDIWLHPMVTDVEERLRKGIQNGALDCLLQNLFPTRCNLSKQVHLFVKVMIKFIPDNSKDNVATLSHVETSNKRNIIAANKSLIENELDCHVLKQALVAKGFIEFNEEEIDDKAFFKLLEDKVDEKTFLKIAEDTMSDDVLKKLQIYNKVWSADSTTTIIPDKILENFSTLAEIGTDLQDFREICTERNILSADVFEKIEKTYSEDKQFMEILVHIVQFGNRDAALALVETLYNNGHYLLASDILCMDNRVYTDREVALENIKEESTHIVDELDTARRFFECTYELEFITGKSDKLS